MGESLQAETIKGFERMLTPEEIAIIIQRPTRYVREKLIKPGIIKTIKTGGNSLRIEPEEFRRWKSSGVTGARFAAPSGGRR